jgi:transposase-like protein
LKRRGLTTAPQIAVADGALGFWKALGEVWPTTREQRCWVPMTRLSSEDAEVVSPTVLPPFEGRPTISRSLTDSSKRPRLRGP